MRHSRIARALGLILILLVTLALPALAQDFDDVMGGFEDEDPTFEALGEAEASDERFWDVSGSFEVSGTLNYLSHRAATPAPGRTAGADYTGLQRLRIRLNLELDIALGRIAPERTPELFEDWQLKVSGWGFYDPAYRIQGRANYTDAVLATYELDAEHAETYLQGSLHERVDFKLGRQIVIWGRSENNRVLDVLNPLDLREPGRVDLEDLRRPVTMLKLDAYAGDWSISALAIPEHRPDRLPVPGSDFFNFPGLGTPLPVEKPDDFRDPEFALAINGIFSGWDFSINGAYFFRDTPRLKGTFTGPFLPADARLVFDRQWMVGAGGNYTTGSWLFKSEIAYVDGLGFAASRDRSRLDFLFGIEFYGIVDTNVVIEVLNRHILDHDPILRSAASQTRENMQSLSFRISQDYLNDTLHATAIAILNQLDARDGAILRFDIEYDVRDALAVGVGILVYQAGELAPFDAWNRNDRIFFNAKWSF